MRSQAEPGNEASGILPRRRAVGESKSGEDQGLGTVYWFFRSTLGAKGALQTKLMDHLVGPHLVTIGGGREGVRKRGQVHMAGRRKGVRNR